MATQRIVPGPGGERVYDYYETRELASLVNDAAELIRKKGEAAFHEFRASGSRWRQGETYVFVLDRRGNMLVHPDRAMEGRNELELKDVGGKPIVQGLIAAATTFADKPEGWYHYQWPVPGEILPRWKSTYVRLARTPSGNGYIVGAGVYNDRMERAFVVDLVTDAAEQVEKNGRAAFPLFHDPTRPYLAKDAYVFVIDGQGVQLVNPAFPNLEGINCLDVRDTQGKRLNREILQLIEAKGSGWVDYMWPKPGESVSTRKSTYVTRAKLDGKWVAVGCGVYLAGAPQIARVSAQVSAPALIKLVRDAAAEMETKGERAFAEFRREGSKWLGDGTYLFVWKTDGSVVVHAGDPGREGLNDADLTDVLGRPIGKMFLEIAGSSSGEGWVHYMWPEPGNIFPTWKSTFVKRVTCPSGQPYLVASGIYNMKMDRAFVEDVVNRAAELVADRGQAAFPLLRDRKGPFVFMDTYVFVQTPEGTELVNPAQPSLEGRNLIDLKDLKGKAVVREEIDAAMKEGSAWMELSWYKPGDNRPARKLTFVRKVQSGEETFIVGSGVYMED